MDAPPLIELDGLGVRLGGRPILKDLRASLNGRAVGLLGPNGAGKTTLINTLLGFYRPAAGTARVLGRDIRAAGDEVAAAVGYMPENDAFIAGYSAVRFIRLLGELSGLPSSTALERAHEALFYVGLGEARYRKLETYSQGMKQLAKLAQAIVHGPRVIFLDEPTNGLDPPHRSRMLEMIREIRDQGETRILLSSHLLRDVEEVCDEVLILKEGAVAATCDLNAERAANKAFVEIELAEADDDFADEVSALGCTVAVIDPHRLKVVMPTTVTTRDLYRLAASGGVRIRRLDYKRDTLQELFLKAMES